MSAEWDADFRRTWPVPDPLAEVRRQVRRVLADIADGDVAGLLHSGPGRQTLALELADRPVVVKLHSGVGWREIFKNLLSLHPPVLGATREWHALGRAAALGIGVPQRLAMVSCGINPAARSSLLVMQRLATRTTLEDLCVGWPATPPAVADKRALIDAVAEVARRLHDGGMCHRDFYLCHFHLVAPDGPDTVDGVADGVVLSHGLGRLMLIDWHRALWFRRLPRRWRVKDLAGLLFSALDIGLGRRDLLRFVRAYRAASLRETLVRERRLWRAVLRRAGRDYRGRHGRSSALLSVLLPELSRRSARGRS